MLIQTKVRVFAFERATAIPVTGDAANITAKWAKDYGTPTALTDLNPVEAEDGFYYFDLSAGERDVAIIGEIFPESSTSGVQVIGVPAFFMLSGSKLVGPFTRTITVTDSVSGDPIEGVSVRLSLAADTESQLTNASGVVSFTVSAGTWSYEVFRSGYAGASGTVVVDASGGTAVVLVANVPSAPINPNNATLRVVCIGEDSQIEPGAIVMIRMIEAPADQVGYGYDGTAATFTADANGIAEREVARGATYEIRREGTYKQWQQYVMPTDQDLILITSFVQP